MAGHSKWSNIKHRKGAKDKKRGKVFTKLIREIIISARIGGGDPESNPRLRKAITNSKSNNMSQSKIDRAIKKGTGELEGTIYYEAVYEGFGPYGISVIIKVITDNKNRTVANIRHLLTSFDGNLGDVGSVSWNFEKIAYLVISNKNKNREKMFELAINSGAIDLYEENDLYKIIVKPRTLNETINIFKDNGYDVMSYQLDMIPKTYKKLESKQAELAIKFLNKLDENDDVNKIYTNFISSEQ